MHPCSSSSFRLTFFSTTLDGMDLLKLSSCRQNKLPRIRRKWLKFMTIAIRKLNPGVEASFFSALMDRNLLFYSKNCQLFIASLCIAVWSFAEKPVPITFFKHMFLVNILFSSFFFNPIIEQSIIPVSEVLCDWWKNTRTPADKHINAMTDIGSNCTNGIPSSHWVIV